MAHAEPMCCKGAPRGVWRKRRQASIGGINARFEFGSILFMNEFDNPDWNLSQAAAWVVYREQLLVEQLGTTGASSSSAMETYPSLSPAEREKRGALKDRHSALRSGNIGSPISQSGGLPGGGV